MQFYVVLAGVTVLIAVLTAMIVWRTRQIAFPLGIGFLYYWSLYGAWLVTRERLGHSTGYKFDYLFYKMFPIYLDDDYLFSILLYALFIVTVQVAVLCTATRPSSVRQSDHSPIRLSHFKLLAISATCAMTAFFLIRDVLSLAISLDVSGYALVSSESNGTGYSIPLYSVYQVAHHAALTSSTLGLAVFCSGSRARFLAGKSSPLALAGYIILLAGIFTINTLMGNRATLLFSVVAAGLFYLGNTIRPSVKLLLAGACCAPLMIVLPGLMRNPGSVKDLLEGTWSARAGQLVQEAGSQEVEAFAAHASMYGAVHKRVPMTYGTSFVWLSQSIVPRALRSEFVPVVYTYYAAGVGAATNQGFTIHHATGWYLNFGTLGLVAGALVLGWIWARLFNNFHRTGMSRSHPVRVFYAVAFWTFTAYMPGLIRSGPEVYKAVAVEALAVPTAILILATMGMVLRENRPHWAPLS